MSAQETLFGQPVPGSKPHRPLPAPDVATPGQIHRDAHDTERAAADLIAPRTGTLRALALEAFANARDGLTHEELAEDTGVPYYSIAPRATELLKLGWIVDSGQRRRRHSGNRAIVWTLSERGRAEYPKRGAA